MFKSRQYRVKAAQDGELVKSSAGAEETRKFQDLDRFVSLANNERDFADAYYDAVHIDEQERTRGAALAAEEEHILRCLGAAVIMQWNTLPTSLQRKIFRYRRIRGQVVGDGGAPRADRPIFAQAQE